MMAFFVCFIACYFVAEPIYGFLTQPLAEALPQGRPMIYTALYEAFFTYVKVAMFGALCIAFPFMAWQLWMFIAPGLYRHERSAFVPFLLATPVMFILGAAFVYYVILPFAIRFFLGFETPGGEGRPPIELQARVGEYLSFVMTLIFAFGFCFELPVLLTLLGRVGIVTSQGLASARRYAIVAVVAVAAVVTPPDVFSQVSLSIPLIGLYEISIWCVRIIERNRARREAAEAADSRNIQPT
jgi:sec-independent protein translocase protein TatC